MRHQKQIGAECALAAACMAYGEDYAFHHMQFTSIYGASFGEHAETGRYIQVSKGRAYLERLTGRNCAWFMRPNERQVFNPDYLARPALNGQGILTIAHDLKGRHSVAWSNGDIYDSSCYGPLSWDMWAEFNTDFRVDAWHKVRRDA